MRKMTITSALNELKLYDAKITKAINGAGFVEAAKKSSDKINTVTKDTFNDRAKASYQSITDLIANRNAIKSAIVKSNAVTNVTVNNVTMTVAEAIERKTSILYEQDLLATLKSQYADAMNKVDKENKKVDSKIDEFITAICGKDTQKKDTETERKALESSYRVNNEFEIVDPLDAYSVIQKLEADIDGFLADVDTQLSVSNAVTYIEV